MSQKNQTARQAPLRVGSVTSVDSDGVKNVAGTAVLIAVRTPFYGANDTTFDAGFVPEIVLGGAGQSFVCLTKRSFSTICAQ